MDLLIEAFVFLFAAVVAVPIAKRLGLGSVLGYLIAGIVIAPLLAYINTDTEQLLHFAEFGVVMMLFLVGLELEPNQLWRMRHQLLGLGGLQVGLTALIITGAGIAFGLPWQTALAVGLIVAPSSTAIVVQTLNERGLMKTTGGRASFSVLLFQDIAIIPILAVLPLLAVAQGGGGASGDDGGHGAPAMSLVDGLSGPAAALVTLGAILAVLLIGRYLVNPLFRGIARANVREIFTAAALLLVIGIAVLMGLVGVSAALGTFIAGVVLASSEYRHELEADIEPFKGLLLGLFFITVGAGIDFGVFLSAPVIVLGLIVGVMLVKAAVLYAISVLFKVKGHHGLLMTLGLMQAGEFGFVLLSVAKANQVLPPYLLQYINLVVAISMVITPLLFILFERIAAKASIDEEAKAHDEIDEEGEIIIAGQGRFGQIVNRLLISQGKKAVVLDHRSEQIELLKPFGFKGYFGDPTRPDLLHAAGIERAKILVVAIDEPEKAVTLTKMARAANPDIHIIARAYGRTDVYRLYQAGANDIVREMFDSSVRAARYTLQALGTDKPRAHKIAQAFVTQDRYMLRELASLWDPDLPAGTNKPFIEKTRALNSEIGAAMEGIMAEDYEDNGEANDENVRD